MSQRMLFDDGQIRIGEFIWNARGIGDRRRSVTGPGHLLVIPWSPVRITHDGGTPIVAEPRTAIFYRPRQPYLAEQLVNRPERSFFIGMSDRQMLDCLEGIGDRPDDRKHCLAVQHGPCDAGAFVAQRRLMMYLLHIGATIDPLLVRQKALALTAHLLSAAVRAQSKCVATQVARRRKDCALAAQELILRRYAESLTLPQLAQAVGVSPFHLCRAFREFVGQSIHQYQTEVRVRAALEPLCESDVPLAHLALAVGFSSQSHFTTAFRARLATTPAALRRDVRRDSRLARRAVLAGRARASTFLKDSHRIAT